MMIWAMRDILRRPGEAFLQAISLTILVSMIGTVLLLSQAFSNTAEKILSRAPHLVIRYINSGGWAPLPIQPALASAESVPGVLNPRPRLWGTVKGDSRVFTVLGTDDRITEFLKKHNIPVPSEGEAVGGAAVIPDPPEAPFILEGVQRLTLSIVAHMPLRMDMAAHDVVLVHPGDARALLGIPEGFACDLAMDVFHEDEAEAIIPELVDAFARPIHITTRKQAVGADLGGYARRTGIALLSVIPVITSFSLLITVIIRDRFGRKADVGLLKALGWTGHDIIRLQFYKSGIIAFPCVILGLAAAYGLVFIPEFNWAAYLFFGWRHSAPPLFLNAVGAGFVMAQVAAWVLVPYFIASLWASFKGAVADPMDLIEGDIPY